MARKPLEKGLTIKANYEKWGTGALNIDGTRIGSETRTYSINGAVSSAAYFKDAGTQPANERASATVSGRWPSNLLLDERAAEMLDAQSGASKSGGGISSGKTFHGQAYVKDHNERPTDSGGASRFFYVAKASKRERNAGLEGMPAKPMNTYNFSEDGSFTQNTTAKSGEQVREARANHHPTVKPIRLMEYLITLVCPPGGVVLDPFLGSGSTLVAAQRLGRLGIGIEQSAEYLEIARRRIEHATSDARADQEQLPLDGGA